MQTVIKMLLSPMAFAIGFLWPLITQSLIALETTTSFSHALLAGGAVAIALGVVAQVRGSWIWIR